MNVKLKIAFLCPPYHRGGVTRWMADAALAFDAKGHEVYFITLEPITPFHLSEGRETLLQLLAEVKNTVRIITARVGPEFEFGTDEYRAFVYEKLLVTLPVGTPIIVANDTVLWAAATHLFASYPIVGVLHADEEHYYKLAENYHGRVDALVCVSERVHKNAQAMIPDFDPSKIFTIPCGINLPGITAAANTGDKLQLAYVGRISETQKRAGDLIKIADLLKKNNVRFHLNIIGDGDVKAVLENRAKDSGLEQVTSFYGWLSQQEVTKHLSESDMLILTSDFEGMPVAMMEALAAGCGFVGTRVSGIEDFEFDPAASSCFAVYTVGAIEDAVSKIKRLATVPKGIRMQAARRLAESEFSMEVCTDRYSQVIASLPRRSAPVPSTKFPAAKLLYSNAISVARSLKVRLRR